MKRILSFMMALLLVFSALPVSAEPVEELAEGPLQLASLQFRGSRSSTSAEKPLEPEFSPEETDYTLTVKDYEGPGNLFVFAEKAEDAPEGTTVEAKWDARSQKIGSGMGVSLPMIIAQNSLEGNTLSICLGPSGQTKEIYRVNILRQATLESLTLRDQEGKDIDLKFQRDKLEYTIEDPVGEGTLRLTAKPTVSDAPVTVDGTAITAGKEISCTPQWDENGLGTISIQVGQGDSETEYTVALRKSPPKPVRLELVTAPNKTAYRMGETFDPAGLEVKVILDNGSESAVPLESLTFEPEGPLTKDQTEVTVWYEGLSLTVPITVLETLAGSGSQADPYRLYTQQDMELLDKWVESGVFQKGDYCRMEQDITIEGSWSGLGSEEKPFNGDFDGSGFRLTLPEGSKAVFARTRKATIHDLEVYGPQIADYGLVSIYKVDNANVFSAKFDHVTLVSGTQTLYSGFLGGYASSMNPVYITNCTVESGVTIGYGGGEDHIGSFAGEFNGFVKNCKSSATVYGGSWVGGLVGNQGQSMADCQIENCTFDGTVEADGNYVGGILGGGYAGTNWGMVTAPNARTPSVLNCRFEGSVHGGNAVGGIFGAEACVQQTWENGIGRIQDNVSVGRVSADGDYVGGIIGFMQSLNRYNEISNNYYENAQKGIGAVAHVDTSTVTRGFHNGTYYYDTSEDSLDSINCTKLQTYVELSSIGETTSGDNRALQKTDHNRTDDPLGADKDRLCYTSSTSEPFLVRLETSGSYRKSYTQGDDLDLTGIVIEAVWSDGNRTQLTLEDVDITGYDADKTGDQTLHVSYQGVSANITVTVTPKSSAIHVSVTILGDSSHGAISSPHGLARGGLETWAREGSLEANTTDTVWDVLKRLMDREGLSVDASDNNKYGTVYIRSVNGLGEFDNGPNSGWMYTQNGTHPEVGVSARYVTNGDVIVLHYTDDYSYEEGGVNYGQDAADTGTSGAAEVDALIEKIGAVTYTEGCKARIDAARAAYNALTAAQKAEVTKLATLESAEKTYEDLRQEALKGAAAAIDALIEAIPSPVTEESKAAIEAAWQAYQALSDAEKRLVTKLETLQKARKDYAKLMATPEDKQKALAVMELIDHLASAKDLTAALAEARAAYDALTELQKLLVDNIEVLEQTEKTRQIQEALSKVADIYKATGDYMEKLGTPSVGPIGGEWMVLGLARSGRTVPGAEDYYKTALQYIEGAMDKNGRLHKAKSTDNSRMILAFTALGKDMTQVEKGKLLEGISDLDFVCYQGHNGPIWALLALDSGNYPVAKGATATRAALVDTLLSAQTSDGGWAISGDKADSDMTGMALQALAPYVESSDRVAEAVDKAIARLSEMQNEDGSFSTYGSGAGLTPTSESISQVVVALSALGIDGDSDERFVKPGGSIIDALLAYGLPSGGFRHLLDGERDGMATEQGYYALTAYFRFLEGKTNLYDMTDVIDKGGDPVEEAKNTVTETAEKALEAVSGIPAWTLAVTAVAFFGLGMVTGRRKRK